MALNFNVKLFLRIFIATSFAFFLVLSYSFDEKKEVQLFKIQRSKDKNQIFYDLKQTKNGLLDKEEPITIYWIRTSEPDKKDPLTWIQQRYAYGLTYLEKNEHQARFQFVSYSKKELLLKKNKAGEFKVFTEYKNKWVELNRIFIQIDGGTFWFPKISRVELHAKDPVTNKDIVDIINP